MTKPKKKPKRSTPRRPDREPLVYAREVRGDPSTFAKQITDFLFQGVGCPCCEASRKLAKRRKP